MDEKIKKILEIEKRINAFPKGTLVFKTIYGKKQPYLQQTVNGKTKSVFIKKINREKILDDIEKRNKLINEYKKLKSEIDYLREDIDDISFELTDYKTAILYGNSLKQFISGVQDYKRRDCYSVINDYLYGNCNNRVLILYGLRRTGKTTLIKQAILAMNKEDFDKTAFIQITETNTLADLNKDLISLRDNEYKYIFIDEVTLLDDFISGSALLPDIFVSSGMKIILSGTDSLGFYLSEDDQLFDRTIKVHTTFISYKEFENVLGIKGIDNYIYYGGTMSVDGAHYNKNLIFSNKQSVDEYIDSAIANNIQHSLSRYQDGGHFRHLKELYEQRELTSVINRVVEDSNHRFTLDVLTKDFISHDLGVSSNNLRKENNILDNIDIRSFTDNLKKALEILNKEEQLIDIKDEHRYEIEEYLSALELIHNVDIRTISSKDKKEKMTVIAQPGLRYSQAKLLINNLLQDEVFDTVSAVDKKFVIERILNEIKGRMMEEIVLLETKLSNPDKEVFKLLFDRGEFDMVVLDEENVCCDIYEIKHSEQISQEQYKNLVDKEKCDKTEFKYGAIKNKIVIYRGDNITLDNGIKYINVEDYLKRIIL